MRVAVLWTGLSGYLNACLKELASRPGLELFVSHFEPASNAPFDVQQFQWMENRHVLRSEGADADLSIALRKFNPDILLFCSWHVKAYRRMAAEFAGKCFRVMAMDNCWLATPKQWGGTMIASWYVRPLADAVLVPGERQAIFARKLGFKQRDILWGMYSCDQPNLEKVCMTRIAESRPVPHSFLFIGRFVSEKGLDRLVRAYQAYRERSASPWPLVCCGAGPLQSRLNAQTGITVEGFVQPDQLPARLASSGCLILPSTFEPWGVVVHEATSAGLLVLASQNVGAVVNLVQPNFNGYIFDPHNVEELSRLMSHVGSMTKGRLDAMSRASNLLSKQFSPSRWADTLIDGYQRLALSLTRSAAPERMGMAESRARVSDL